MAPPALPSRRPTNPVPRVPARPNPRSPHLRGTAALPRADLLTVGQAARLVGVSHPGEEFIDMLAGTLEIWLDEVEHDVLHDGDRLWFESTLGHGWSNPSETDAVLLWVNTPPTF